MGDLKEIEDRRMRSNLSGMQIYLGSDSDGTVKVQNTNGYTLEYAMSNPDGRTYIRFLQLLKNANKTVEIPKNLVDFKAFGPMIKDLIDDIL